MSLSFRFSSYNPVLKSLFFASYLILTYFSIKDLYGFSRLSILHSNSFTPYIINRNKDPSALFLKNQQKYQHKKTTLEIEQGRYEGQPMDMSSSNLEPIQSNDNKKTGAYSYDYTNRCWSVEANRHYKKNNLVEKGPFYEWKKRKDEERMDTFSQYVNLDFRHPLNAPAGQLFTFVASTRGELFRTENSNSSFFEKTRNDISVLPKLGMEWSGPVIPLWSGVFSLQPSGKVMAEPRKTIGTGQPFARPLGGMSNAGNVFPTHSLGSSSLSSLNSGNQSETSMLSGDMDERNQALYGGKFIATLGSLGSMDFFLGQKYSLLKQSTKSSFQNDFTGTSPIGHIPRFSDYVGRLEGNLFSGLSINGRFDFDQTSFHSRVSDLGVSLDSKNTSFSVNYTVTKFLGELGNTPFDALRRKRDFQQSEQQINCFLTHQMTANWSLMGSLTKNFKETKKDKGIPSYSMGFNYNFQSVRLGFTVDQYSTAGMMMTQSLQRETRFMLTLNVNTQGDFTSPMSGAMSKTQNFTPLVQ